MYHQTSRKETRLLFFVFDNQYKTKSNNILVTYFGASLKIETDIWMQIFLMDGGAQTILNRYDKNI